MANSDRVYKLYVDEGGQNLLWILNVLLLGVGALLIWTKLCGGSTSNDPSHIFGIIMITWAGAFIFRSLSLPHTISLSPDGRVEFTSRLRQKVVHANEVRAVKPEGLFESFLVIRAKGKKITLLPYFEDFHDFLARLKAMNPNIEVRGC